MDYKISALSEIMRYAITMRIGLASMVLEQVKKLSCFIGTTSSVAVLCFIVCYMRFMAGFMFILNCNRIESINVYLIILQFLYRQVISKLIRFVLREIDLNIFINLNMMYENQQGQNYSNKSLKVELRQIKVFNIKFDCNMESFNCFNHEISS